MDCRKALYQKGLETCTIFPFDTAKNPAVPHLAPGKQGPYNEKQCVSHWDP